HPAAAQLTKDAVAGNGDVVGRGLGQAVFPAERGKGGGNGGPSRARRPPGRGGTWGHGAERGKGGGNGGPSRARRPPGRGDTWGHGAESRGLVAERDAQDR